MQSSLPRDGSPEFQFVYEKVDPSLQYHVDSPLVAQPPMKIPEELEVSASTKLFNPEE
eukprot:gene21706-26106_t